MASDLCFLQRSFFCLSVNGKMEERRQIESGIVHINDQTVHDEPQVPFGGRAALEEFTELRWISAQLSKRQYPF
ncbi:MAG: hypothetical protein WAK95_19520 [Desulfobacterales bacterium]